MSASLAPQWILQALTDAGAVASGAKLYSYVAGGGSVPSPLLAEDGVTPLANPYTFDSAGRGKFLLDDAVSYRLRLETAAGDLIEERDNVFSAKSSFNGWVRAAELADDTDPAKGAGLVGYEGQTVRSRLYALRDAVLDRGADPTGVVDASGIINALIAEYDDIELPPGIFNIASPLLMKAGLTLSGAGPRATVLKTSGTNLVISGDGGYEDAPGHTMNDVTLRGMRIQGDAGSDDGVLFRGASLLRIEDVKFTGFGGRQLILDEVWDSWFSRVYWLNHLSTTDAALNILYGSGDNSNNLRFFGCGIEGIPYRSVYIYNGNTSDETNYAITWDDCKFEPGTVGAASASPQFVIAGVGGVQLLRMTFRGGLIVPESNTQPWMYVDNGVAPRQLSFKDILIPYRAGLTTAQPLLSLKDTKEVIIEGIKAYGPGLPSPYVMVNVSRGGCDQFYAARVIYNGNAIDPFNGTRPTSSAIATGPFRDIGNRRIDGALDTYGIVSAIAESGTPQLGAKRLVGGALGVANSGAIYLKINNANGNAEIWIRTGTGSEVMAIDFVGGLARFGAAWNDTRRFAMGSYQFWVDATGDLRIKNGSPTSDTDGTVVGTQT